MDRYLKVVIASTLLIILGCLSLFGMYELIKMNEWANHLLHNWGRTFVNGVFALYILSIAAVVFLENRDPSKTIAWLLVLFLVPILGFVMYMMIGGNYSYRIRANKKKKMMLNRLSRAATIQREIVDYIDLFSSQESYVNNRLLTLLLNNSESPFSINNKVDVLTNGEKTYHAILEAIDAAVHHIHLEYFIIRDDEIGQLFKQKLMAKAEAGVAVRLIYDSVGCWKLPKAYIRDLEHSGVEVAEFFPVVLPFMSRELNYRNHRKIVIVDGHTGFVGGLNIGDEYLGKKKLGFWRDTHIGIHGESCYALQQIFLNDWADAAKQDIDDVGFFPRIESCGETIMQITSSGPDSDWQSILQAYFTMISTAEDHIWITTPYLVPEPSIMMALKTAALCGKDVRIILPDRADHFLVYWASRDNFDDLLKAGVRIFAYQKGFIHSKVILVDGVGASVGTANLDIRSLEINFEVNAFIYDKDIVSLLENDFLADLEDSIEISLEVRMKRPRRHKVLEALGRLVSPLQ